jgi:hypothetical protein
MSTIDGREERKPEGLMAVSLSLSADTCIGSPPHQASSAQKWRWGQVVLDALFCSQSLATFAFGLDLNSKDKLNE